MREFYPIQFRWRIESVSDPDIEEKDNGFTCSFLAMVNSIEYNKELKEASDLYGEDNIPDEVWNQIGVKMIILLFPYNSASYKIFSHEEFHRLMVEENWFIISSDMRSASGNDQKGMNNSPVTEVNNFYSDSGIYFSEAVNSMPSCYVIRGHDCCVAIFANHFLMDEFKYSQDREKTLLRRIIVEGKVIRTRHY